MAGGVAVFSHTPAVCKPSTCTAPWPPFPKVAEAEKSLRMAQKDLAETKEKLAELNRQLSALRDQFSTKTAEQLDLKAKAEVGGALV